MILTAPEPTFQPPPEGLEPRRSQAQERTLNSQQKNKCRAPPSVQRGGRYLLRTEFCFCKQGAAAVAEVRSCKEFCLWVKGQVQKPECESDTKLLSGACFNPWDDLMGFELMGLV